MATVPPNRTGFNFSRLTKSSKSVKLGGFDDEILIAPVEIIKAEPKLIDNPVNDEDKVVAQGEFTFEVGYTGFRSIMAQSNSVGFTPESIGPEDSKCYKQAANFNLAGDSIENDAFIHDINGLKAVVAIKKGQHYTIIGSKSRPVSISPKPNYGKKAEDGVVHEFEVLCYSDTPAVKFKGTIPVAIEVPPAT